LVKEEFYYDRVVDFLRNKFKCFAAKKQMGVKQVGIVDVAGLRDVGGISSPDIELISIEVKKSRGNFCKLLGQTLGYSLFSHKCYLAIPLGENEAYTPAEKEMATQLGVGLIDVGSEDVREVITSKAFKPIPSLFMRTIWNMEYMRCNICGNYVSERESGSLNKVMSDEDYAFRIKSYLSDGDIDRELLFSNRKEAAKYSYICNNCVVTLKLGL